MGVPVGRTYTSTAIAWVPRTLQCDACGAQFSFDLNVRASGESTAWFFLFGQEARHAAESRAADRLPKALARARAVVACPVCGVIHGRGHARAVATLQLPVVWLGAFFLTVVPVGAVASFVAPTEPLFNSASTLLLLGVPSAAAVLWVWRAPRRHAAKDAARIRELRVNAQGGV